MLPRTRILIGAATVAVVLAAWEFERAEAHAKFAPDAVLSRESSPDRPPEGLAGVPVTSQVAGVVSALYAGVNATVTKGQALALIDSPILRARLDEAKANLEMERSAEMNAEAGMENLAAELSNAQSYRLDIEAQVSGAAAAAEDAKSQLDHRAMLYREGVASLDERDSAERNSNTAQGVLAATQARLREVSQLLDDAQARYDAALDKTQQAKADVRRCEAAVSDAVSASAQRWALAPIDGTVTAVNIRIGQSVEPGPRGAVLFQIAPREVATSARDPKMPRRE